MSDSITVDQIRDSLSAALRTARLLSEAEARVGGVAALGLILTVEQALADLATMKMDALAVELAETLPSVCGGAPDDDSWEVISSEFLRDPWPSWTDSDRWEATPLEVLALDARESAERTDADWDAFYSLRCSEITDSDLIAAGLAVG